MSIIVLWFCRFSGLLFIFFSSSSIKIVITIMAATLIAIIYSDVKNLLYKKKTVVKPDESDSEKECTSLPRKLSSVSLEDKENLRRVINKLKKYISKLEDLADIEE